VVAHSCNVGFVEVGLRLGTQTFYDYLRRFRVLGTTGIDLPGEARSIVPPESRVKPIDLATMAFGQTLALTPISLVSAIGAIADGGIWHQPHLMKEIKAPDGKVVSRWHGVAQRIVPEASARTAVQLLEGVVQRGSGRPAQIPGYPLAGKTGTAQAVINGRYVEGKYISSFVGFGPAKAPRVAMLVQIFEPVGPYYGGQIAAPVVGRAMARVMAALGVPPETPEPKPLPDLLGMSGAQAQKALKGLGVDASLIGPGSRVTSQFPPAAAAVEQGSQVLVYLGKAGDVTVPDLRAMTVDAAAQALDKVGLRLQVEGEGTVQEQEPAPGTRLPLGATVWVRAKSPAASHNM
jgi:stage V sporulation protein D (sporulation-specific penicillin-binding protein)